MAGQAAFPYECFVINLDRQPERLAEFQEWNSGCGLDVVRFAAIDGALLDEATCRTVTTSDRLTRGMIGSALSHRRLWEHAVRTYKPVVIFEDDAVLRADIATTLPAVIAAIRNFWDIILLGFNANSILRLRYGETSEALPHFSPYPTREELFEFRISQALVAPFRLANAFGICGYVVSPIGAEKLLDLCFPIEERPLLIPGFGRPIAIGTVDTMMNVFYNSIDAYICLAPLVMAPNDPATSGTLKDVPKRRKN